MKQDNIFDLVQDRKTLVVFDGANMFATLKNKDVQLDFLKLRDHVDELCENVQLDYFTPVAAEDSGFSAVKPLTDLLSYNGYRIKTKLVPTRDNEDGMTKRLRSNVSTDISVHVMSMVCNKAVDHIVLFSGDGELSPLLTELRNRNVRVTVVSSKEAVADSLRRGCNEFIDVEGLRGQFTR